MCGNMMYDLIHGESDQENHPRQALLLRPPMQTGRREAEDRLAEVPRPFAGHHRCGHGACGAGRPSATEGGWTSPDFGAIAALYDLATRLRIVECIDRHVSKRGGGPTVGTYLLVAAINRCVAPCSKASIADWFGSTALRHA